MAFTQSSSGVSAAAIGCIILSIALLTVIVLNAAAYVHFKRAKGKYKHVLHVKAQLTHIFWSSGNSGNVL